MARRKVAGSPRRWRLVARRWFTVALTQAVALSVVLLGASTAGQAVVSWLASVNGAWKFVAMTIVLGGTSMAIAGTGVLGNLGAYKAYVNPPRWLQLLIFAPLAIAAWTCFPATVPESIQPHVASFLGKWGLRASGLGLLGAVLLVATPHLAAWLRRRAKPNPAGDQSRLDLTRADFKRICEWLRTDDEIRTPRDDAFSHARIATRIADRIVKAADGDLGRAPTFALVGELGAGKSSVLELVRHSLRERDALDRRILLVHASLWPFDSPEAAIRGVLAALEVGFSKVTSISPVAHAPGRYLRAIGKLDKRAEFAAEILSQDRTPIEALEAYGRLAELIGVHVVVWIEDLERFDRSNMHDGNRASPIRALLYQLQRIDQLTVVLASDTLNARVDLQKIARFVESIPRLSTAEAWPVVSRFRDGCLAMLAPGEQDPAAIKARRSQANDATAQSEVRLERRLECGVGEMDREDA
jgi:hypothetical protein